MSGVALDHPGPLPDFKAGDQVRRRLGALEVRNLVVDALGAGDLGLLKSGPDFFADAVFVSHCSASITVQWRSQPLVDDGRRYFGPANLEDRDEYSENYEDRNGSDEDYEKRPPSGSVVQALPHRRQHGGQLPDKHKIRISVPTNGTKCKMLNRPGVWANPVPRANSPQSALVS